MLVCLPKLLDELILDDELVLVAFLLGLVVLLEDELFGDEVDVLGCQALVDILQKDLEMPLRDVPLPVLIDRVERLAQRDRVLPQKVGDFPVDAELPFRGEVRHRG